MLKIKNLLLPLLLTSCMVISGCKLSSTSQKELIKFSKIANGLYLVDINTKDYPESLAVYLSDKLETVDSVAEKTKSNAAINAGFFDPTNSLTTSYVIKDGKLVADPTENAHLMLNSKLSQYLPAILNRSELRMYKCDNEIKFDITTHNAEIPVNCKIENSVQGGPELFPKLRLEEEIFVVRNQEKIIKESASALHKCARSAIAIKGDHILLIAVKNKPGMTLPELAEAIKNLGVDKAMAFDGGSSTSLFVKSPNKQKFILNSAKNDCARRVKSIITVRKPIL